MKNLFIVFFLLPIFCFGQNIDTNKSKKQIIKIKPSSIILGDFLFLYEREIFSKHSMTIGFPLYFKRDIAKMGLIQQLAPFTFDKKQSTEDDYSWFYYLDENDFEDLLDDAEGIGSLSGYGIILKYKWYINKYTEALTGFYFSPEYFFRKFNIEIDASESDLQGIYSSEVFDNMNSSDNIFDNYPEENYELDGIIKFNTFSINLGHQWIRDWISIDMHIGLAHYNLQYEFEEDEKKVLSGEFDEDDTNSFWLPRFGLNLGVAF